MDDSSLLKIQLRAVFPIFGHSKVGIHIYAQRVLAAVDITDPDNVVHDG